MKLFIGILFITGSINGFFSLSKSTLNNFDRCIRKKDLRYASCSIPDVGFSLSLPDSKLLQNFSLAFIGDSFIEQVYFAFQCINPDVQAAYYKGGISKSKMCFFLSRNKNLLGTNNFNLLILSEGLWFNPHFLQNNGMQVQDYVDDVSCAIRVLKEMQVEFIWVQKSFQHFNTKEGIVPTKIHHLSKIEMKRYANCVPIKQTKQQLEYHRVVLKSLDEIFFPTNSSSFVLEDKTRDMHMMHTKYQRSSSSIPDCTHFCQKKNGVPFQYAKRITNRILER
jgi:hypothetical protein